MISRSKFSEEVKEDLGTHATADSGFDLYYCYEDVRHYRGTPASTNSVAIGSHPWSGAFSNSTEESIEKARSKLVKREIKRIDDLIRTKHIFSPPTTHRDFQAQDQTINNFESSPPSDSTVQTDHSWAPNRKHFHSDQDLRWCGEHLSLAPGKKQNPNPFTINVYEDSNNADRFTHSEDRPGFYEVDFSKPEVPSRFEDLEMFKVGGLIEIDEKVPLTEDSLGVKLAELQTEERTTCDSIQEWCRRQEPEVERGSLEIHPGPLWIDDICFGYMGSLERSKGDLWKECEGLKLAAGETQGAKRLKIGNA